MSIAFTDWVIEEQEREKRLDLKEHTKALFKGRGWKIPERCNMCKLWRHGCRYTSL